MNKAVFLDRDGTINEEVNYLYRPADFRLLPGVTEALRLLRSSGYLLIVVTNQAGVARGYYTEADVEKLHRHMDAVLAAEGASIDAYYHCSHHPEGTVEGYAGECGCRKPGVGMLVQAVKDYDIDLKESIMIGDKEIDVQAGRNAGVGRCFLVRSGHPVNEAETCADQVFEDLVEAARALCAR